MRASLRRDGGVIQNCWREHPHLTDAGFCIANEIDAHDFPACILNQVAARDLAFRQVILGSRRGAGGGSDFRPEFFSCFCGASFSKAAAVASLDPSRRESELLGRYQCALARQVPWLASCSRGGERAGSHCRAMGAGRKPTDGSDKWCNYAIMGCRVKGQSCTFRTS